MKAYNAFLRDVNVGVRASDEIEVLAQDLPCFGGALLAIDITLRGVVSSSGEPHPNAADVDGAVLARALADKEAMFPGGAESSSWRSKRAADGGAKLIALVWEWRWTRMLSTVCSLAFASSLELSDKCATWCWTGGEPSLAELLGQDPR